MARIKMTGAGSGAPGFSILRRPFSRFVRPTLGRRSVNRLQKRDPARGVTDPAAAQNLETRAGYATANTGGNRGAAQIHQQPQMPPTSPGVTTIKAPNPKGRGSIGKRVR